MVQARKQGERDLVGLLVRPGGNLQEGSEFLASQGICGMECQPLLSAVGFSPRLLFRAGLAESIFFVNFLARRL